MKDFIKKNITLIVAFALPVWVIVIVAIGVYFPSFFVSTKYDFVYISCSENNSYQAYDCNQYLEKKYSVTNNKLSASDLETTSFTEDYSSGTPKMKIVSENQKYAERIFFFDTKKNEGREITLEEAKALSLNGLVTSPDGVTVSGNYENRNDGFFIFGGGGRNNFGYYLTKGSGKSKLNLINISDSYYSRSGFKFIGWVLPGRN
jgi:hypothetical protein